MIGRVLKCQEVLKIVDKTPLREGTVNFGKERSGRSLMKEGRNIKYNSMDSHQKNINFINNFIEKENKRY